MEKDTKKTQENLKAKETKTPNLSQNQKLLMDKLD